MSLERGCSSVTASTTTPGVAMTGDDPTSIVGAGTASSRVTRLGSGRISGRDVRMEDASATKPGRTVSPARGAGAVLTSATAAGSGRTSDLGAGRDIPNVTAGATVRRSGLGASSDTARAIVAGVAVVPLPLWIVGERMESRAAIAEGRTRTIGRGSGNVVASATAAGRTRRDTLGAGVERDSATAPTVCGVMRARGTRRAVIRAMAAGFGRRRARGV
jgi:hypothetical protein